MEIWKDIEGFIGYYKISNFGNIKSVKRIVNYSDNRLRVYDSAIIKSHICGRGYNVIRLTKDKSKKTFYIHQLVAMAFLNHIPCGSKIVVNHKDFNKLNNHIDNLELVTNRVNSNKKHLESSSQYTGVCWHKINKRWTAQLTIKSKYKYLGSFKTELEASICYENYLIKNKL